MDSHCSREPWRADTVDTELDRVADRWRKCVLVCSVWLQSSFIFPCTHCSFCHWGCRVFLKSYKFSHPGWNKMSSLCSNSPWLKVCFTDPPPHEQNVNKEQEKARETRAEKTKKKESNNHISTQSNRYTLSHHLMRCEAIHETCSTCLA